MIRRIIVMNTTIAADGEVEGQMVFRLDVPASIQPYQPNPGATSVVPDATPEELAALRAGTIREIGVAGRVPVGTPSVYIEAQLAQAWQHAQDELTAQAPPARYIGATWDGTTWTGMP